LVTSYERVKRNVINYLEVFMWPMLALAGGSALLSAMQASNKAKQDAATQRSNMLANAEQMRYSPWSGMSASFMPGQALESPGGAALGAGLQGGLQGAMFGQQFAKGMASPKVGAPEGMPDAGELDLQNQLLQRGQYSGRSMMSPGNTKPFFGAWSGMS
jgi:hypothetical protein